MLSLTDFISLLPGVMPRKARTAIMDGGILNQDQKRDIFYRAAGIFDTVQVVGPDAAAAILTAYRSGALPMGKGKSIADAPEADSYIGDAEKLRGEIAERHRRESALKDISLVQEKDFADNRFLDKVFWAFAEKGPGTLTLAGIAVRKDIQSFPSNSGQSWGHEITFHWTGSDGVRRSSGTGKPPEASNRRNDEERNWGLHE